MTFAFFYRASLGGPDERREQKFATLVGESFLNVTHKYFTHTFLRGKPMNGGIAGKDTGVFQIAPSYTKPLETPTGMTKGSKVYKSVTNSCVTYLD